MVQKCVFRCVLSRPWLLCIIGINVAVRIWTERIRMVFRMLNRLIWKENILPCWGIYE